MGKEVGDMGWGYSLGTWAGDMGWGYRRGDTGLGT